MNRLVAEGTWRADTGLGNRVETRIGLRALRRAVSALRAVEVRPPIGTDNRTGRCHAPRLSQMMQASGPTLCAEAPHGWCCRRSERIAPAEGRQLKR